MGAQHCGYWCLGAKTPGPQHTLCWPKSHCIGPVLEKYITFLVFVHQTWNSLKKMPHVLPFGLAMGSFFVRVLEKRKRINSLWPGYTILWQGSGSPLVQVMVCLLFGTNALPKPIVTYHQLDPQGKKTSMYLKSKYNLSSWKCSLQNVSHFVQASMY